jgi:hypothetical protein
MRGDAVDDSCQVRASKPSSRCVDDFVAVHRRGVTTGSTRKAAMPEDIFEIFVNCCQLDAKARPVIEEIIAHPAFSQCRVKKAPTPWLCIPQHGGVARAVVAVVGRVLSFVHATWLRVGTGRKTSDPGRAPMMVQAYNNDSIFLWRRPAFHEQESP